MTWILGDPPVYHGPREVCPRCGRQIVPGHLVVEDIVRVMHHSCATPEEVAANRKRLNGEDELL